MVPSVEPFQSFFCRLYHDEVGIHTFEMHYYFSLPDEQAIAPIYLEKYNQYKSPLSS